MPSYDIYNHGSFLLKKNQMSALNHPVFASSFMKPSGSLKFLKYPGLATPWFWILRITQNRWVSQKSKHRIEPQFTGWFFGYYFYMFKIGGYTAEPVLLSSENSGHETKEPPW
jgi:hypothetical protein